MNSSIEVATIYMKKSLLISIILIIVISGVSTLWYFRQSKTEQMIPASVKIFEEGDTSPIAPSVQDELVISAEPRKLPLYQGDPIDNIGEDPFIQQVPADYLEKYKQELANFKKTLAKNPGDVEGWIRVGVLKKFFNNYDGARDAWEYAKIVNPEFSTPYYNLGVLYGAYLKDLIKAEENYLKAIEIDPSLTYLYLALAEFYSVFYKEKIDRVDDVLRRGLAVLPDNESLLDALRNYKESGVIKE